MNDQQVTIKFYTIVLEFLKLIIDLHYCPFRPGVAPVVGWDNNNDGGDDINLEIRCAKVRVLTDSEKFLKTIKPDCNMVWLTAHFYRLVLRSLRVLIGIHFHCETGEQASLPSLSKPRIQIKRKCALIEDMTIFLDMLNQGKMEGMEKFEHSTGCNLG